MNQLTTFIFLWLKVGELDGFPLWFGLVKCIAESNLIFFSTLCGFPNPCICRLAAFHLCSHIRHGRRSLCQLHMKRWLDFSGMYEWRSKDHYNGCMQGFIGHGCKSLMEMPLHFSRNTVMNQFNKNFQSETNYPSLTISLLDWR